jgi:hypothetical protein
MVTEKGVTYRLVIDGFSSPLALYDILTRIKILVLWIRREGIRRRRDFLIFGS